MATAQVQALLRFLSQEAKVPLATAMSKIMELQKSSLTNAEQISKADIKSLQEIFKDNKLAKQVFNAAKRVSKKREAPKESTVSPQKRAKVSNKGEIITPFQTECALSLPTSSATEEELSEVVLLTNRAPLVLAFAICTLRHTMPEQPISSRLSLAQAVVSANSRSKAVSLGIASGDPAEQEGWGEGQPEIKILGREIKVLKKWDYDPREGHPGDEARSQLDSGLSGTPDDTLGQESSNGSTDTPPLWGIDLEALRSAHRSTSTGGSQTHKPLPIFTPDSVRSYLCKSFARASDETDESTSSTKRKRTAQVGAEREACLGHLLRSIDMVCQSWAPTLSKEELDRRAWAWYLHVRPTVQSGVSGWGEKGLVKLSDILNLKRQP